MPSCATLASSALRRCLIEVRSWRCHTQRTPAGEIDRPRRFSISETRTWPQAGCSVAIATTACSISIGVRFFRRGLRRLISCSASSAAFVVKLLETVEAVAAVAHHFAGLADITELLGQLEQPELGSDNLLFLGHSWSPSCAGGRVAVPARGENRAPPPAPLRKPTTFVRLSLSYYTLFENFKYLPIR